MGAETHISTHFKWSEVTDSNTADENRIDNSLPEKYIPNAIRMAQLLEDVRSILGMSKDTDIPISVNSWYRCPKLNALLRGSSPTSAHRYALAADIRAPKFGTPLDIALVLQRNKDKLAFDQIIYEGRWVHIGLSCDKNAQRQSVLTRVANGYQRGIHKV